MTTARRPDLEYVKTAYVELTVSRQEVALVVNGLRFILGREQARALAKMISETARL